MNMRALNGRESTLSNWLDNESEKFREMRVLAGPTLKTVMATEIELKSWTV